MERKRVYAAIDLKSFYASVECADRQLDPLDTCLVVADASRSDRTICLAVSPALKQWGIPGRPRLFEVMQKVDALNALRRAAAGGLTGKSCSAAELKQHPSWQIQYITAVPRMKRYMEVSGEVVNIYLRYVAPEDLHVYSVDEVFLDLTPYLPLYGMDSHELVRAMVGSVLGRTGITATAGIGSNLYLCKIAMDMVAKHMPPDGDGVRIASLDELSYRKTLWNHRPLTDFWRIGPGTERTLARIGLYTMGDVARMSLQDPELLYHLFGVNAELLIDHAWGWESCRMEDIKRYQPKFHSLSSGQVLPQPCDAARSRLLLWEMADLLALDLAKKQLATDQLVLDLGYDKSCLMDPARRQSYRGPLERDHYGRLVPASSHGSWNCPEGFTASNAVLTKGAVQLFDRLMKPHLLVRRITLTAGRVRPLHNNLTAGEEPSLFAPEKPDAFLKKEKEKNLQQAVLALQERYGKNALLKGSNLLKGAMTWQRNQQVGGHKA